jgi:ribonuclease-3
VSSERSGSAAPELDDALGVRFEDPSLRAAALTHRSYAFEQELGVNNERLEFLGDAVLGLVVTDMGYNVFRGLREGELA